MIHWGNLCLQGGYLQILFYFCGVKLDQFQGIKLFKSLPFLLLLGLKRESNSSRGQKQYRDLLGKIKAGLVTHKMIGKVTDWWMFADATFIQTMSV